MPIFDMPEGAEVVGGAAATSTPIFDMPEGAEIVEAGEAPPKEFSWSRVGERAWQGAKQRFGDEPIGFSQENREKYPITTRTWQPFVAPLDAAMRGVLGGVGGVAGVTAGAYKEAGGNPAMANRLERDVNQIGDVGMAYPVSPAGPRVLPTAKQQVRVKPRVVEEVPEIGPDPAQAAALTPEPKPAAPEPVAPAPVAPAPEPPAPAAAVMPKPRRRAPIGKTEEFVEPAAPKPEPLPPEPPPSPVIVERAKAETAKLAEKFNDLPEGAEVVELPKEPVAEPAKPTLSDLSDAPAASPVEKLTGQVTITYQDGTSSPATVRGYEADGRPIVELENGKTIRPKPELVKLEPREEVAPEPVRAAEPAAEPVAPAPEPAPEPKPVTPEVSSEPVAPAPVAEPRVLEDVSREGEKLKEKLNRQVEKNLAEPEQRSHKGADVVTEQQRQHTAAADIVQRNLPKETRYPQTPEEVAALRDRTGKILEEAKAAGIKIGKILEDTPNDVLYLREAADLHQKLKKSLGGTKSEDAIATFLVREKAIMEGAADEARAARKFEGEAASRVAPDVDVAAPEGKFAERLADEATPERELARKQEGGEEAAVTYGSEKAAYEAGRERPAPEPRAAPEVKEKLKKVETLAERGGTEGERAAATEAAARIKAGVTFTAGENQAGKFAVETKKRRGLPTKGEALKQKVKEFAASESGAVHLPFMKRKPPDGSKKVAAGVSDKLYSLRTNLMQDRIEAFKQVKEMPKEHLNARTLEQVYHVVDEEATLGKPAISSTLPPELKAFYNTHLRPIINENKHLYAYIKDVDPALATQIDTHLHRMAKGKKANEAYESSQSSVDTTDPVVGFTNTLHRSTGALKERVFYAIEDAAGNRKLVSRDPDGGGFTLWDQRRAGSHVNADFEVGNTVKVNGTDYTIKQALTREIEQHGQFSDRAPAEYVKNPIVSLLETRNRLREVARHMELLDEIKNDPQFQRFATTNERVANRHDWKESAIPQLRGWRMNDRLREVFNDFYKPGFEGDWGEWLRKTNQFAIASIFWNPVPHIANVGVHWYVARGWDWVTPKGWKSLATDGVKAIKSTVTQDKLYQQMLKDGAPMIYAGVMTREFSRKLGKMTGMDIKRNPSKWDPIARTLGVGPSDLIRAIYSGSRHTLWAANDVFMIQRILELEKKGRTRQQAIKEASIHIPDYRVPARVMENFLGEKGSRDMSQFVQDPRFVAFGRYHYGVFKSLAHMAKDLVGPKATAKQRLDAFGNLAALGSMVFMVKPILDYLAQAMTGNPEAEQRPRGPVAPIQMAKEVVEGKKGYEQGVGHVLTMQPMLKLMIDLFITGKDFAGRNIIEPADVKAGNYGKVGAQVAEHTASALVSPYGTTKQAINADRGLLETLRDNLLDIKNPSEKSLGGQSKGQKIKERERKRREKKPRGLIEKGYNELSR
jgi:hypothetical protein